MEYMSNKLDMKFKPREYQQEAISNVLKGFKTQDRGKLIMPCGTGKSWTYLWLYEAMGVKRTIVFVPSLTLIKQIKNDWLEQRSVDFNYLCVCSDKDVDDENTLDEIENVTTIPAEIQNFMTHNLDNNVVIYSTYHSAERIIEALKGIEYTFDLIINDEAHRTAGIDNVFGIVHDNTLLPAKKRLYGTATPRILGKRRKIDDRTYNDMNDEDVYGQTFYSLSYRDAIKMGIICDYKIVVVGVNDKDIHRMISDERINIKNAVNVYTLQYCLKKYGLNKVISFHSRIKNADVFTNTLLENNINSLHINGGLSGEEKEILLGEFRDSKSCVITNARCLTEGINIPSVDGIFYAENKSSIIDIVQSTGRALRKSKGKELGYIIVPIYTASSENIDKAIVDNEFSFLIDIVSSMCMQDDTLQDLINDAVRTKSKNKEIKEIIKNNIQFDNIKIDIADKIFGYVINENGYEYNTFEENVELYKQGINVNILRGGWRRQFKNGILSEYKIQILNEIGALDTVINTFEENVELFKQGINTINLSARWRSQFLNGKLSEYTIKVLNEIGGLDKVITKFEENVELYKQGINVNNLRGSWRAQFKNGTLSEHKVQILNEIGALDRVNTKFKENVELFKQGINVRVLKGSWRVQLKKGRLSEEKIKLLNSIGGLDKVIYNLEKNFEKNVELYKQGINVKELKYKFREKIKKGKLSEEKIELLKSIGALDRDINTFEENVELFKQGINVSLLKSRWRTQFKRGELSEKKIKIISNVAPYIFKDLEFKEAS